MARSFNGTTYLISCGTTSPALAFASPLTISAWANPGLITGAIKNIFEKNNANAQDYGIRIFSSKFNGFGDGGNISSTVTLSIGVWYQIVYVMNGASSFILVNGTTTTGSAFSNQPGTAQAVIGTSVVNTFPWTGQIADVAIWNVALTALEAAALNAGIRPPFIRPQSIKGYWPLDGLASPEPDFSLNGNNGTLTGTTSAFGPPFMPFTRRYVSNLETAAVAPPATPFIFTPAIIP